MSTPSVAIAMGPRVKIIYVPEVTKGVVPATPAFKTLRTTGRDINLEKDMLKSKEVFADKQLRDIRHGLNKVMGKLGTEWSLQNGDDFMASALSGAWASNALINGVVNTSFTIERQFLDIGYYQLFSGVEVDSWDCKIQNNAIVTSDFNMMGIKQTSFGTTSVMATTGATLADPPTHSPLTAFEGVMTEGGSAIAVVTGIDFSVKNGRSLAGVVGSKFSPDVFDGTNDTTGTLNAYVLNATLFNKFLNETTSAAVITLNDLNGTDSIVLNFPHFKYTGAKITPPPAGGIVMGMPYQALYDTGISATMSVTRSA